MRKKKQQTCTRYSSSVVQSLAQTPYSVVTRPGFSVQIPSELLIRVYTDGSAEEAGRNGGGGVLIEWLDGTKMENSIPTGRHSNNYKAEAAAIEEAVALLHTPKSYNKNIALLSDAKSVLQAL